MKWGESQARRLASLPSVRSFRRTWLIENFQVQVKGSRHANGEFVVYLTVTGGMGTTLFNWPSDFFDAATTGVQRITLSSDDISTVAPSSQVRAVKLPALGTGFHFSVASGVSAVESAIETPLALQAGLTIQIERMVRNGDWFARPLIEWLLARTTFRWMGQTLTVTPSDCFISPWDGNDFMLLLGSFPAKDKAEITAEGKPLVDHLFTGVAVPWSTLTAILTATTPTVFSADLDAANATDPTTGTITRITTYTRKDIYGGGGILNAVGDVVSSNIQVTAPSPFVTVYMLTIDQVVSRTSFDGSIHTGTDQTNSQITFTAHSLLPTGEIEQLDLSQDVALGSSRALVPGSVGPVSVSGTTCDLTFFSGERFLKYGTHTFAGGTDPNSLPFSDVSCIPLPSFIGAGRSSDNTPVALILYVREHDIGIAMAANGVDLVTFSLSDPQAFFGSGTTSVSETISPWAGILPLLSWVEIFSYPGGLPPPDFDATQVIFGPGPYFDGVNFSLFPVAQANGIPRIPGGPASTVGIGGVYWHRDGPLGVLLFQTSMDPTEAKARSDDVTKYRSVFTNQAGYRAVGADGNPESGYEDPVAILARIAQRTTVIINNFASASLFPWLDAGFVGVILDP